MGEKVVDIRDVTIRYEKDGAPAIDGISFSISNEEKIAMLGLNGSGKTTLLKALVGLLPFSGKIEVCGIELRKKTISEIREKIGYIMDVPEDQILFPIVIDDVTFSLRRRGVGQIEARKEAMDILVALEAENLISMPVHHLSHGQKQRVALAGAMISKPPILLLDEPSQGLDPPGKKRLAAFLKGTNSAVLIATHDLKFARKVCSRFMVLDRGRLVYDGDYSEEALADFDEG